MKIAHVIFTMERGGAEKLVALMCRMQRQRGDNPGVHCLQAIGAFGEELQREGFAVTLHGPATLPQYFWRLYREFRRNPPDVVHCHNATPTIAGAPAARLAGVRCVVETRHQLVGQPLMWRREVKFAVASRFCHWNVGVSEATRRNLLRARLAPQNSLITIYNGAPTPNGTGASLPASLPDNQKLTLLHIGRLVPDKDQATMLHAFASARAKIPNLQLWIVGDGFLQADLRKLADSLGIAQDVTFWGEQAAVGSFLGAADVFLMSSVSEGLPVSILEAMGHGLPLVVTDVGGMAEVVRLADCGVVVPRSDPEALARAICDVVVDHKRLSAFGSAAQTAYQRYFRPETMLERYDEVYRNPPAL